MAEEEEVVLMVVSPPLFLLLITIMVLAAATATEATWCVARSDASNQALQTALDYACGSGADCTPIQPNGLCFLPNTIQAHASYAFNSFYQRKAMAPGSCDFAGTTTIAKTDPSYGSCVYPSSLSTAGGAVTPSTPKSPTTTIYNPPVTPLSGGSGGTGLTPGGTSTGIPTTDNSKSSTEFMVQTMLMLVCFLIVHLFIF